MMELDFSERSNELPYSQEDYKFLNILKQGISHRKDGHYQMPLPFKTTAPQSPNNKAQAERRLVQLKRRFMNDSTHAKDYTNFMQDVIDKGYAEKIPQSKLVAASGCVNYIPHHGVYHAKKGKIRVVFDCIAKYKDMSLNDHLLTGPNLTTALIGVLSRFRHEPIAFICDIEAVFHQFKVDPEHRDYLRFLWWESGDYSKVESK